MARTASSSTPRSAARTCPSKPAGWSSRSTAASTGDLLLVWNDHSDAPPSLKGLRTPLRAAVSQDGGKTWSAPKTIESDPAGWYCYTAIEFVGGDVLLAYCAGKGRADGLNTTRITFFPLVWLYNPTTR